jgi:hypothetical protein
MNAEIRQLLEQLHQERRTGLLSLVIAGGHDTDGADSPKEALSLSFVTGELAAAEARHCQGLHAMRHLAQAQRLLRQRWYPVGSNVLKRMEGMPALPVWIQQVEAETDPAVARSSAHAKRLDEILRVFRVMGGMEGIERFLTLTTQHPPESAWEPLMQALYRELTMYLGEERAAALAQP